MNKTPKWLRELMIYDPVMMDLEKQMEKER